MPKQSRRAPVSSQEKKPLTARQKETAALKKETQRFLKTEAEKRNRALKAAQDKQYKEILKRVSGKGIYEPKGKELTAYRRRRAKTISEQWGEFLNPKEYFFLPANKDKRASILDRAKSLEFPVTTEGLFVRKGGHTKARFKEDKKRGEFYIERTGKTKRGPNAGRKYTSVIPLAGLDQLDAERDRIAHAAEQLMPLNAKEELAFIVMENGVEGRSQNSFGDIQSLLERLDKYDKKTAARLNFYRHIEVVKVESGRQYAQFLNSRDTATPRGKRKTRKVSGKFDNSKRKGR